MPLGSVCTRLTWARRVDSDVRCNPVDSIGSSTESRVSHSEPRLLLGFQGTKTARREGTSSPFSDAGGCTSRRNSGATVAESDLVRDLLKKASADVGGHKFSMHFLMTEWAQVVDAWQLEDWESYRDVARLGRKTRIPELQRKVLWSIIAPVRDGLKARKLITEAQLFTSLATAITKYKKPIFD